MKKFENQSNEKPRYYPLRNPDNPYDVDLIPLTEEEYRNLYRNIWRIRKKEQRAGRCHCNKKNLWMCAADCDVCPYHTPDTLSLDAPMGSEDDESITLADLLADPHDLTKQIENEDSHETLYSAISELEPRDRQITHLFMEGRSERAIAELVGCSQKTVSNRKKAVFAVLFDKLKHFR